MFLQPVLFFGQCNYRCVQTHAYIETRESRIINNEDISLKKIELENH